VISPIYAFRLSLQSPRLQYQKAIAAFRKNPNPPGVLLHWVCRDNLGYRFPYYGSAGYDPGLELWLFHGACGLEEREPNYDLPYAIPTATAIRIIIYMRGSQEAWPDCSAKYRAANRKCRTRPAGCLSLVNLNPAVEVTGSHDGVVAATHCGEICCHPEGDLRGS
jgi:hypothetical protein